MIYVVAMQRVLLTDIYIYISVRVVHPCSCIVLHIPRMYVRSFMGVLEEIELSDKSFYISGV